MLSAPQNRDRRRCDRGRDGSSTTFVLSLLRTAVVDPRGNLSDLVCGEKWRTICPITLSGPEGGSNPLKRHDQVRIRGISTDKNRHRQVRGRISDTGNIAIDELIVSEVAPEYLVRREGQCSRLIVVG